MYQVKHGRDFTFPGYEPNYPKVADYKLEHVKVEVYIYFDDRRIEGYVTLTLSALKDNLMHVDLDAKDMTILKVEKDKKELKYDYDGSRLTVHLDRPLQRGKTIDIHVSYEAKPKKGLYFVLPGDTPDVKVYQVWSQGESEENSYWIPLYDYPNNKCTSEVIAHVPKGFIAVSNGELVEKSEEGKWCVWHWKMDVPHSTYLIDLAAGDFEVVEEKMDNVKLEYYVPRGWKDYIPRSFSRTADILKFYGDYTGVPYPYTRYAQICVDEFIFGGMENTTATILTTRTLHDEIAHMDFESEHLVAHEAAHQWFGDLVTTKDWSNIWLNESFATYFEALYTRHWKGEEEFTYEMIQNFDAYLKEYSTRYSRPIVTRVFQIPIEMFDAHSYPKGAVVLHTLKNIIGEDNFKKAVKLYLERFKFNVADTEDLRKVFEEVVKKDLEWFFDQFVYNAGHPVLNVSTKWDNDSKMLTINIKQKQGDDSLDIYKFPIEVEFQYKDGKKERKTIQLSEKSQSIYVPLKEKPEFVYIDPEFKAIKVLNLEYDVETLIKLLKSEYVYYRVLAARTLPKFKSRKVVDALKDALINEKFWGAAAEMATALGKINLTEAMEALLEAEKSVKHPKVRRAIMSALGNYKEEKVAEVLAKVLADDKESYYVRTNAAISLGKTKWPKAYETLMKYIDVPSHTYTITRGVLNGLGELGTEEALQTILEYTDKKKPTYVRAGAAQALGKFPDKKAAQDKLIELLNDENLFVKLASVNSVKITMDPRYLPVLDSLANTDIFDRIRRAAKEVARYIRKNIEKGVEYKKLLEELDKMREEHRKLFDNMLKLEAKGVI